jgi:predicted RNase H-like HicB family nuclease
MSDVQLIPLPTPRPKSYLFRVVLEPHETGWRASCPALFRYGASAWGSTRDGAIHRLQEAVEPIVLQLIEQDKTLPEDVFISSEPVVAITT